MIWGIIGKTQTSRPPVALNQGRRRHPFSPFGLWQTTLVFLVVTRMPNAKDFRLGVRGWAGWAQVPPRLPHGRQVFTAWTRSPHTTLQHTRVPGEPPTLPSVNQCD